MKLITDSEGNVILKPIVDWAITDVDAMNVLLQVFYEEPRGPQDDSDIIARAIQFVLKPQVALRLSEALASKARQILEASRAERPN